MPRTSKTEVVASISIYGTSRVGFGWLASVETLAGRVLLGNGEPREGRSATCAVWIAADAITMARASHCGLVEIHIDTPNGPLMATAPLSDIPTFGALKFGPGRVYTASAEEIERCAEVAA